MAAERAHAGCERALDGRRKLWKWLQISSSLERDGRHAGTLPQRLVVPSRSGDDTLSSMRYLSLERVTSSSCPEHSPSKTSFCWRFQCCAPALHTLFAIEVTLSKQTVVKQLTQIVFFPSNLDHLSKLRATRSPFSVCK